MEKENRMILSDRLQTIADLIGEGCRIADIGTDHGYLPIYLLQQKKPAFVAACDINRGPLEHAQRSAAQYGLEHSMSFRLGNGLACIDPNEVDTIIIAGMGGETIAAILEAAPWTNSSAYRMILQPMTKVEFLRPWLAERGYVIEEERLVYENRTYFPVLSVRGGGERSKLTLGQTWGGVALDRDPLQQQALSETIRHLQYALSGLEKSSLPENTRRAQQHREIIRQLESMKEEL